MKLDAIRPWAKSEYKETSQASQAETPFSQKKSLGTSWPSEKAVRMLISACIGSYRWVLVRIDTPQDVFCYACWCLIFPQYGVARPT